MFKKNERAVDFSVTIFVLMVISTFCQPGEAKVRPSLLALDKISEELTVYKESKYKVVVDLELEDDIINLPLFVYQILKVKGVLVVYTNQHDRKKFRIVFDPKIINYDEVDNVIGKLISDPRLYEE
ncbi:MAG: MalM family protein [Candidatus Nomurabacteria bacterium]|nr:MalM family protein [Candidatus Nomurabacteria bacterium]